MRKIVIIHFILSIALFSCTNSLGKKGKWDATYKQEFLSNCKTEIQSEETLSKLDSVIVSKICNCVADRAEKEFAPLEMEEKEAQSQMKTISTDCARAILMEK